MQGSNLDNVAPVKQPKERQVSYLEHYQKARAAQPYVAPTS